jgi:hypothetical protein
MVTQHSSERLEQLVKDAQKRREALPVFETGDRVESLEDQKFGTVSDLWYGNGTVPVLWDGYEDNYWDDDGNPLPEIVRAASLRKIS